MSPAGGRVGGADLRRRVERVLAADSCSGCGACSLLSPHLEMAQDAGGYLRPRWVDDPTPGGEPEPAGAARRFSRVCPGVSVTAPPPGSGGTHPTMGPWVSVWSSWATDADMRYAGSSGGVLTALSAWLVDTGQVGSVVAAGGSPSGPGRTTAVRITSREEALAAAGSRYAPASTLAAGAPGPAAALVGKPCEVDAARRLAREDATSPAPVLLSFFCAGVPSQHATDELVTQLTRDDPSEVLSVRYRGRGWPGAFTVESASGGSAELSYARSWGEHLGRRVQERCKVCPDGTGGHADVAVGDYWRVDASGFPLFEDADGVSVAIARTARGHELLMAAREAGVLALEPLDLDDVAAVQPLQTRRRASLLPRLAGRVLARRRVPVVRGYHVLRLALAEPRESVRQLRGAYARARS